MADSIIHNARDGKGGVRAAICPKTSPVARAAMASFFVLPVIVFLMAGCAGNKPPVSVSLEARSALKTRFAVIKYSSREDLASFSKSLGVDSGRVGRRVDEMFAWVSSTLNVPAAGRTEIRVLPDPAALNAVYAAVVDENHRVAGSKAAFYDRRSNTIYFPARGSRETTLVHEMVHALAMNRSPFLWYSIEWHEQLAEEASRLFMEGGGTPARTGALPGGLPEYDADFERGGRQGAAPPYHGVKGVLGKLLDE